MYPGVRLYPGELIHGAIGRLCSCYGLKFRQFNTRLLNIGGRATRIRSALDFRAVQVWKLLWPELTMAELLREHTLAPMFIWRTTFRGQVPYLLKVGSGVTWEVRLPRGMEEARYKFCPLCWQEELERYGERHWDTLSQIPGVNVCHKHGTALWETNLRLDARNVPIDIGYVTPEAVAECQQLRIDEHSLLIVKSAQDLLRGVPSIGITIPQWLEYLCWLMKSERMPMVEQYRLLESARMHRLVKKAWGSDYEMDVGWEHPLANLKDFRWWGWMKLLRIISPQKKLVNALKECYRVIGMENAGVQMQT